MVEDTPSRGACAIARAIEKVRGDSRPGSFYFSMVCRLRGMKLPSQACPNTSLLLNEWTRGQWSLGRVKALRRGYASLSSVLGKSAHFYCFTLALRVKVARTTVNTRKIRTPARPTGSLHGGSPFTITARRSRFP